MKRVTAVLLVVSLLLVAGCGKPAPTSQQGKVSILGADDTGASIRGAAVTLTGGDGKVLTTASSADGTVKMGSGNSWQTLTGDEAKNFGYGDTFVTALTGRYLDMKRKSSDYRKSDGGSVNGYDTDKYTYSVDVNGTTLTSVGYFVKSGEFKGAMTRYDISYQNDKDATKRSGFTIDTYDLNKSLGVRLP